MVLETPTSASGSRDPKLSDLDALAAASEGFSGAEIEQAVVAGLTTAFSRGVEVSSQIIAEELKATKPLSVTRAERSPPCASGRASGR